MDRAHNTLSAVGIIEAASTAEIEAPLLTVWTLVADVERAPAWQGGLRALVATERDDADRVTLAETVSDGKLRAIRSQVRFRYEAPTRLSWDQTRGDLRALTGSWELEALGDQSTRATYRIACDLGRLGLLIRGPIVDLLRSQLAGARANELKATIEGAR